MPETILGIRIQWRTRVIDAVFKELTVLALTGKKVNKPVNIKDEARAVKE